MPNRPPLAALGDSITNGGGTRAYGVPCRSWAAWLAESMALPFVGLAADGARAPDVLAEQVPRLPPRATVGCLFVGVNDARSPEWDAVVFAEAYEASLDALLVRCERVVTATLPLDLGRPLAGGVADANAIVERAAMQRGVALARLERFGGRRMVMPDHVHPTALGQLAIADAAAVALGNERLPSSLVQPARGAAAEVAFALAYGWQLARDLWRRAVERARFR